MTSFVLQAGKQKQTLMYEDTQNAWASMLLYGIEVDLMALEVSNLRLLSAVAQGSSPGAEASMLKIRGSEVKQRIAELTCQALGYYVNPYEDLRDGSNAPHPGPDYAESIAGEFLIGRAATIYGGSNEIQRNVIAKMVLGL